MSTFSIKDFIERFVEGCTDYDLQPYGEHGLKRRRIQDFHGLVHGKQYEYFCSCGEKLSEGPEGGLSINAVCKKCKINYGCLPGYYGDQ